MTTPPVPERIVRCPGCGNDSAYSSKNPYRPFCSHRCKTSDFGAWASENYRVDAPTTPEDPDDVSTQQEHRPGSPTQPS
ncbi:MAG: DNA gyrase inhibitor YacG [Burkholderiaceae bacterium]|nr:DNA gyrase inhibitor YacG [Burkholderiaceae bacterium]